MVYLFVENRQRNLGCFGKWKPFFFLAEHLVLSFFLMEYSMNHKFGRTMESSLWDYKKQGLFFFKVMDVQKTCLKCLGYF